MHINGCVEYCKAKGVPSYEKGMLKLCTHDKVDWESFVLTAKTKTKEELIESNFSQYVAKYGKFADMVYSVANRP